MGHSVQRRMAQRVVLHTGVQPTRILVRSPVTRCGIMHPVFCSASGFFFLKHQLKMTISSIKRLCFDFVLVNVIIFETFFSRQGREATTEEKANLGQCDSTLPIVWDDTFCDSSATSLFSCSRQAGPGNCNHGEDVHIVCDQPSNNPPAASPPQANPTASTTTRSWANNAGTSISEQICDFVALK